MSKEVLPPSPLGPGDLVRWSDDNGTEHVGFIAGARVVDSDGVLRHNCVTADGYRFSVPTVKVSGR